MYVCMYVCMCVCMCVCKSGTQYATAELFFRFVIQVQRPGNNGVSGRQATPEAGLEQPGFWHTVFRPHVRGAKILVVIAV